MHSWADDSRAMADDVSVPLRDGTALRAALTIPDGAGPHPGVLVIHEVFGLNDDMRRVAGRLTAAGYAAIVPDLLSTGDRAACLFRLMGELARGGRGRGVEQLQAAHRWLASHDRVDAARQAVIGFCMGGGFALLYASPAPH